MHSSPHEADSYAREHMHAHAQFMSGSAATGAGATSHGMWGLMMDMSVEACADVNATPYTTKITACSPAASCVLAQTPSSAPGLHVM